MACRTAALLETRLTAARAFSARCACWAVLTVGLTGCGPSETPSPPAARSEPKAHVTPVSTLKGPEAGEDSKPAEAERPFQPPFPQREELFVPPDQSTLAKSASESEEPDLKLKGFVNFQGLRVMLEMRGKIATLREGEERNGVKVVSIAPPRVVLQSEGRRWTESLLDSARKPTQPREDSTSKARTEAVKNADAPQRAPDPKPQTPPKTPK